MALPFTIHFCPLNRLQIMIQLPKSTFLSFLQQFSWLARLYYRSFVHQKHQVKIKNRIQPMSYFDHSMLRKMLCNHRANLNFSFVVDSVVKVC